MNWATTGTSQIVLAAAEEGGAAIHVGHHTMVFELFGMTFNGDTIMATGITALIVIALAFVLRAKVTSTGVPGGVQLFWEALTIQMQGVAKLPPFLAGILGSEDVPVQFVQMLPYVLTIVVLAGFIGHSRPPRALGLPYGKK